MISQGQTIRPACLLALFAAAGCNGGLGADDAENAIIDPPTQCSGDRPDCSLSEDYPDGGDLTVDNSAGIRFSQETGALVVDRLTVLPDIDGDGVPDDADDCPGTPDWISCDNDPTNDGLYATVFYDPAGSDETLRTRIASTVADIPAIDVYFLIDATMSMDEEIVVLQAEISNIVADIRLLFDDAQFGVGLYRAYPLPPLGASHSQSPYHHVLDLTDDDALVGIAVSTLNEVDNPTLPSAATQALYSVASGLGLGDMVPNRGVCPDAANADVGYPCFRPEALHVVMNITDAEVYNGPRPTGPMYTDPPFDGVVGTGVIDLPPVEMYPALFDADDAASALDLGDLSNRSATFMGMSTLLNDAVKTVQAPGCIPPPPVPPDPPGMDDDGNDAVLAFRFDSSISSFTASANNTHWPAANVALFNDALLDPTTALACNGDAVGMWGALSFAPVVSQQYYLVADGFIPDGSPGHEPEGAFSISIVHDGDPPNSSWLTSDAPVGWTDVETALLASHIRVASVVTLRDAMVTPSDGNLDARLMAQATDASTPTGEWVAELPAANGEGLDSAVSNTIALAKTESVYDIKVNSVDDDGTPVDEREFIQSLWWDDCSQGDLLECGSGAGNQCRDCEVGAIADFEVVLFNTQVAPTASSQVFDFELLVQADNVVEVERIPVRVMVPDALAHEFDATPESAFYRNVYDSTARCNTPPERPKWGDLTWVGSTPGDTSIEFQIRTAPSVSELEVATPAIIQIPADTISNTLNIRDELIADEQLWGLPYIQITAILNAATSPPTTPTLEGWTFEFVCEAAE